MTPEHAIAVVLCLPSLFFVFLAVRGMWRFYRDNRPTRMATPWADPRSSLALHKKMVSRQ